MNVDTFLAHHHIRENPFGAEEARHDPIFERLVAQANQNHPDFAKILGQIDRPSTSVVFGEKGTGKTAIRLLISRKIAEHNAANPGRRILAVPYDDLNPILDRFVHRRRRTMKLRGGDDETDEVLKTFRLEDHQDAILSLAVTRVVDAILGYRRESEDDAPVQLPDDPRRHLRKLPRRTRVDLAVLAALYDQPRSGLLRDRHRRLLAILRVGNRFAEAAKRVSAIFLAALALMMGLAPFFPFVPATPGYWWILVGLVTASAVVFGIWWIVGGLSLWSAARGMARDMPVMDRDPAELQSLLGSLSGHALSSQPLPADSARGGRGSRGTDTRYQLTRRFLGVLEGLNYRGMMILVDRLDEPAIIAGDSDRMRTIIWPMFDNKFLQQEGVGFKLLLPIELRHFVHRESAGFFQEARLDKQNLIDRLSWSGATLYDLCAARIRACQEEGAKPILLTDLFEPEVSRDVLVDALDQMHQPRDAFKFLYAVIQEHCRMVPEDDPKFQIPRLTVEAVRRMQSQRVQEFYRGLAPA